jgi:hypothetical protein
VQRLDAEGIDPDRYSLSASNAGEQLCLEKVGNEWAVYYAERGLRTNEHRFSSEDEACQDFLHRALRDPSMRRRPTHIALPDHLATKAASFPEHSMGVVRVTAYLNDGRVVPDVFVSGGQIVKVGAYPIQPGARFRPIPFASGDIADITHQP